MADQNKNSIQNLIDKFNRPVDRPMEGVRGVVEATEELSCEGIVVLHIKNGPQHHSFFLALDQGDRIVEKPLPGDSVVGVITPYEDKIDINGDEYMAIFDFENISAKERQKAQEYFSRQRPGRSP